MMKRVWFCWVKERVGDRLNGIRNEDKIRQRNKKAIDSLLFRKKNSFYTQTHLRSSPSVTYHTHTQTHISNLS